MKMMDALKKNHVALCRTPRTPEAAILGHFVEIQTFLAEHQKSGGGAISRGNGDVKEWEKL